MLKGRTATVTLETDKQVMGLAGFWVKGVELIQASGL